ncbi:MAG: DUF1851 domain-containing protein [Clostridiales Family XIII bacterium]|jgi:hypothetical protein|nr:DUF1851 domain-containing protein [Clostridiales Family XIII bacterium]
MGNEFNRFKRFVESYKPQNNLIKPTKETLDLYKTMLPDSMLDFWKEFGFGNYADGLIKIIDPSDYMAVLRMWLGLDADDCSRIPILITGFGDVFYYRKLTETDEDVSFLDIHYRKIEVCTWSLTQFFEDYITNERVSNELFKTSLFVESIAKKGALRHEEIFYFTPALVLGGGEEIKYIDKGIAHVHQALLFELGQ